MKVITRTVICMRTFREIEEESFEYKGPIAKCKGGGGSSGKIDYPDYMERVHEDWLDATNTDTIGSSVTAVMTAALAGASPWSGLSAYDPGADVTAYEAAIAAFAAILAAIVDTTNWAALYTQAGVSMAATAPITAVPAPAAIADEVVADKVVADKAVADKVIADKAIADIVDTTDVGGITEARIVADVDAFADQLDDEINNKVLPRYRGGMRDINSVISSAFPIGQAIIEAFRNREVAKHASGLRLAAEHKNADIDLRNEELHLEVRKTNVGKDIEIEKANLSKDVTIEGANLGKDIDIDKANLGKDVEIARANLNKDVDIGKANLSKDIELERMATTVKSANLEGAISIRKLLNEDKKINLIASEQMLRLMIQRITWEESYMRVVVEGKRIKIVAKKEQTDTDAQIDANDALWDLEVFQHGANVMASIGSGTGGKPKPSLQQSVLGGAMSGAAAGGMATGNIYGAAVGAFLGGAAAYASY